MAALVLPVLLVYLLQRRIFNALPLIGRSLPEACLSLFVLFPFKGINPCPIQIFPIRSDNGGRNEIFTSVPMENTLVFTANTFTTTSKLFLSLSPEKEEKENR